MNFPDRDILRIFKTAFNDRSFETKNIKFNVKKLKFFLIFRRKFSLKYPQEKY